MKNLKYKPLLFTTTMRNPERLKIFLNILLEYNNKVLTNEIIIDIVKILLKYGLYKPNNKTESIRSKWNTRNNNGYEKLINETEINFLIEKNPQQHKEAGFDKGWSSRFATWYNFSRELGLVYYRINEKIKFSEIGIKLATSVKIDVSENQSVIISDIDSSIQQYVFLNAMVKYQRKNPFIRVLNDNVPLILLLNLIKLINNNKKYNQKGLTKLEVPLLIFWKNNNFQELYELIISIREKYSYKPSWEVIINHCKNTIMQGEFKKFKDNTIMSEYPDEFIRKMRLTGLITLRGGGRFIDLNKNEIRRIDYIINNYSNYNIFNDEKKYFDYMAKTEVSLHKITSSTNSAIENDKKLQKWTEHYPFKIIKKELSNLTHKQASKDPILKYLSHPVRLEFLIAIAIKSKFPSIHVKPNYPCDDEGIPTSTASGKNNQGDIECVENNNGVLIEVTMSQGRIQTVQEVWPIERHLEEYLKSFKNSICYFVAPTFYPDSIRQISYIKDTKNLYIYAKTIIEFVEILENKENLYFKSI